MQELEEGSDEYVRVKYLVDLGVPSNINGRVNGLRIKSFRNNDLKAQFDNFVQSKSQIRFGDARRSKLFYTQPCWFNLKEEQISYMSPTFGAGFNFATNGESAAENLVQKINEQNLSLPENGSGLRLFTGKFATGDIDFRNRNNFILCQVAVGQSFVVDDVSELEQNHFTVPEGFDSLYLALQNANNSSDSVDYRHNYAVFDQRQILPLFFVSFSIEEGKRSKNVETDDVYSRYDFFDPILYKPVSVKDKMVGSHSTGQLASHKLIKIDEAFNSALFESNKEDEELKDKLKEIRSSLTKIDDKLNQVNANAAKVEELIYETLQDALFFLQDETQGKLNRLLSEEVELRRRMQQVTWMQQSLSVTKANANRNAKEPQMKVDFLNNWKCYCLMKNDICRNPLATDITLQNIHADMELVGGIEVVSQREFQRQQQPDHPRIEPPRTAPSPTRHEPQRSVPSPTRHEPVNVESFPQFTQPAYIPAEEKRNDYGGSGKGFDLKDFRNIPPELLPKVLESLHLVRKEDELSIGRNSAQAPPTPDIFKYSRTMILDVTPQKFASYSLHAEAMRKMRQLELSCEDSFDFTEKMFSDSRLISASKRVDFDEFIAAETKKFDDKMKDVPVEKGKKKPEMVAPLKIFSQAQELAFCLPIYSENAFPETKLLFASWLSSRSSLNISSIIKAIPIEEVDIEDEEGNFLGTEKALPEDFATLLVLKSGSKIFGAYIDEPLRTLTSEDPNEGVIYGSPKCFLFSLDLDVKIPFHGAQMLKRADQASFHKDFVDEKMNLMKKRMKSRAKQKAKSRLKKAEESEDEEESDEDDEKYGKKMGSVLSNEHKIQVGVRDLWLTSNLKQCGSQIEHTFGCGLRRNTEEANTLLAGKMVFDVDEIEVWGLQS